MKTFLPIILALCLVSPQGFASDENTPPEISSPSRTEWARAKAGQARDWAKAAAKSKGCQRGVMVFAAAAALAVAGLVVYNWPLPEGQWNNLGSQEAPSWTPEVHPTFYVDESSLLNLTRERIYYVNDGEHAFGKVVHRADKLVYLKGDEVVAETCPVSPTGRPLNPFAIRVTVQDGFRRPIGTIEEHSEKIGESLFRVHFRMLDLNGTEIGRTQTFEETGASQRQGKDRWALDFSSVGAKATRSGFVSDRYTWENASAEVAIDPRLEVLLTVLKDYVEAHRK